MPIIINSRSCSNARFWTKHLQKTETNERVEVVGFYGLSAETIKDAFSEMRLMAQGSKAKNFFSQYNINPVESLTEKQWEQAHELHRKNHGLDHLPYFRVRHIKDGRIHEHGIALRVDPDTGKAISDSLTAAINERTARQIEQEFGLAPGRSVLTADRDGPRPERRPKKWEQFRGSESGIDPHEIARELREIKQQCDTGQSFKAGAEDAGYVLARGDRRDFMVIDRAGDEHSLGRRLGIKAAELRAFMTDVDPAMLPSVEEGREMQRARLAEMERQAEAAARPAEHEKHGAGLEGQGIDNTASQAPQNGREVEADTIRMYRGIGNNVAPARPGDALFFSTDPERAAAFGELHYVDIAVSELGKFERPHSQRILRAEPIAANDWRTDDLEIIARLRPLEAAQESTAAVQPDYAAAKGRRDEIGPGLDQGRSADPSQTYRANAERMTGPGIFDRDAADRRWSEAVEAEAIKAAERAEQEARAAAMGRRDEIRPDAQSRKPEREPPPIERQILDAEKAAEGDQEKFDSELAKQGLWLARVTAADVQALDQARAEEIAAAAVDPTRPIRFIPEVREGELAAVDSYGGVHRLNQDHMAGIERRFAQQLDQWEEPPSVTERREALDLAHENREEAFADRQGWPAGAVNEAEQGITDGMDAAAGIAGGAGGAAAEFSASIISSIGENLFPTPPPTREERKQAAKAAEAEAPIIQGMRSQQEAAAALEELQRQLRRNQQIEDLQLSAILGGNPTSETQQGRDRYDRQREQERELKRE